MTKDFTKVPVRALNLCEDSNIKFSLSEQEENGKKKRCMSMTGYSGGVIQNHWWWGNLAIDISGMSFPKKSYPILRDHSTSMIIGHSPKPKTDDNKLQFDDVVLCDTEWANDFLARSDEGVPFEASIYAQPTSIERVEEGEIVDVNGYKFKGPGTIWRKSTFKECSVCVFGYDSNTSAVAMNENAETLDVSNLFIHTDKNPAGLEEDDMPFNKLRESHPDEYQKFVEGITAEVTSKFTAQIEAKDAEIAKLSEEKKTVDEQSKTLTEKFADLEKKFTLQIEANIANQASGILKQKFGESGLPERISQKLSKFVDYSKFVEGDKLNVEAFSAAIDTEIKEAKEMFGETTPILGGAGAGKELGNSEQFSEEAADALAKSMLATAGLAKGE